MTINLRSPKLALLCSVFALTTLGVCAGEAGASSPRTAPSPQAVTGLKAAQSERSVVVSWRAPGNLRTAGVGRYRITIANASRATAPFVKVLRTSRRSVTVAQLAAGAYRLSVVALGRRAQSRAATTTVTIPAVTIPAPASAVGSLSEGAPSPTEDPNSPPAPGGFAAIPGPGTITLVWEVPAAGGMPVRAFQIRARATGSPGWFAPTALTAETLTRELTIPGTTAWEFQIRAVGDLGGGAWSAIASAAPGPPS